MAGSQVLPPWLSGYLYLSLAEDLFCVALVTQELGFGVRFSGELCPWQTAGLGTGQARPVSTGNGSPLGIRSGPRWGQ